MHQVTFLVSQRRQNSLTALRYPYNLSFFCCTYQSRRRYSLRLDVNETFDSFSPNNGYFPSLWKLAKIIPIKKKIINDNTLSNFRPISLLSNIGKLFESVLKEKMENELPVSPISAYQFGFKSGHSTQHALLKLHSDITSNLRNQVSTVAISLDIQKAFDSVCHTGVLYKLIEIGIDPYLVKLMASFFTARKFLINIKNTSSATGLVNSGVPQGSILAPYLFNIFLYDFPHIGQGSQAILYADDCLIYKTPELISRASMNSIKNGESKSMPINP